jgi:hypothetical protein
MLELVLLVAAVVAMSRIAAFEERSSLVWGGLTLILCLGSLLVPLPFLRVGGAFAASFVILWISKIIANR